MLLVALSAADMLLPGLEGETQGLFAVCVLGDADEAAGHLPFECVAGCHESGMGAAVAHGHTKTLGTADGDVGAPIAGGCKESQGEQVGGDDYEGAGGVGGVNKAAKVADRSLGIRVLQQDAERIGVRVKLAVICHDYLVAQRFGADSDGVDCLGMATV